MNNHRGGPTAAHPSPETTRQQLGSAERELAALRAELDTRLSALEGALAKPDSGPKLDELVFALARVATTEAESAAVRAALAARLEAQETAGAAVAELQRTIDGERAIAEAVRVELAQAQSAFGAERETVTRLHRELVTEREALGRLQRQLDDLRVVQEEASAGAARRIDELEQALQRERGRGGLLDAALAKEHEAVAEGRDTAARLSATVSTLRDELTAARQTLDSARETDGEAHRAALDAFERRCTELDRHHHEAVTRLAETSSERDALRSALEAARQEEAAAHAALAASAAAIDADRVRIDADRLRMDAERASAEQRREEAEALAAQARTGREELAARLEAAEHKLGAAEMVNDGMIGAVESRLATIEADRTRIEAERADAEQRRDEAEARAVQAHTEREEIAARLEAVEKTLETSEKVKDGLGRTVKSRLAAIDAERTRAVAALREAETRAETAIRECGRLAAELEAARSGPKLDSRSALLLKTAAERIRALELELAERDHGPGEEVDLEAAAGNGPPVLEQAGQRAQRFGFSARTKIRIDREEARLIDLSVTGAQVICKTSPEVGRIALVTLPSDVAPCFGQGRLLWARREPTPQGRPHRYRVGLVFTEVDQAALEAFIKHHSIN